ncbi:hypothetical protein HK096_003493 [Nowakowskiella sp. JEL0078]|nr:hypothetical protein HK096_003493 [Nowakowskiella sp. JEL0078]
MADFKTESQKLAQLEKEREIFRLEIKRQKEQIEKDNKVRIGADKFVVQNDFVENELKRQTVGLVQLEDFERIQANLDVRRKEELEKAALGQKKKSKRKNIKEKLSFAGGDEEEQEEIKKVIETSSSVENDSEEPNKKKTRLKKDPTIDTSFLPDKEREEEERRMTEELKSNWLKEQKAIKQEKIVITYSYWDGTGHRTQVEVKKGDSISQFLEACRQQWHQLRGTNVDNLMYVKEDLIIPHHYTFYDFIVNKTRGKSGPLFSFDVFDDVRLTNDATIETEESHAGKLIERAWYEKNKHIFPASRWEVFDPQKFYGKYTVKDLNKKKESTLV